MRFEQRSVSSCICILLPILWHMYFIDAKSIEITNVAFSVETLMQSPFYAPLKNNVRIKVMTL